MAGCGCKECMRRNGPQVGQKVYIKPDRINVDETLPPDLADSLKTGNFEVLQLDNSRSSPSAFLKMPSGVGVDMRINGQNTWVWCVWNTDIYATEEPERPKEDTPISSKKYRAGDVVRTSEPNRMHSGISKEEHKKGFRVLGVVDDGMQLVVELPDGKGDQLERYGMYTNTIPVKLAISVSEYEVKAGDYVQTLPSSRTMLTSRLSSSEHDAGFKVLGFEGRQAVIELPGSKGLTEAKYPGKSIARITVDQLERAPTMKFRKGDKVRVKSEQRGYLPNRLTSQQKMQSMEILEVRGEVGYREYTVKFPDGTTGNCSEHPLIDPNKEGNVSDQKFKKGMKVKISEDYRDELPDSLSESAKRGSFEVISVDEYGSVRLKMPKSCDELEYDDTHRCHIWYIDDSNLEEPTMGSKRGTVMERIAANAKKGVIKTAGRKLTKTVKAGLLRAAEAAGKAHGMDTTQLASGLLMFTAFMESEFGAATISALIGLGIAQGAPHLAGIFPIFADERMDDLADEMQSEGAAVVMEKVMDILMTYIAPDLANIFDGQPPKKETKTKVRIKTETAPKAATKKKARVVAPADDEEEETEQKATRRHAA